MALCGTGVDVDCAHRGFSTPQRVCVICAGQKHALLISQTQAGMAELLLANKNFEAAIAAAEYGVKANSGYEEKTVVDPGEAERLKKAMAKNLEVLETARAAKVVQDEAREEMRSYFDSGEMALEARDWDGAVEYFEAGLAPDLRKAVNGEKNWRSCVKEMETALTSVAEYLLRATYNTVCVCVCVCVCVWLCECNECIHTFVPYAFTYSFLHVCFDTYVACVTHTLYGAGPAQQRQWPAPTHRRL